MVPAALALIASQATAQPGLEALKAFADTYAKSSRYLCVYRTFQPEGERGFETDGTTEVWLDKSRARVVTYDMWGEGGITVTDGKVLLADDLYGNVTLNKAPSTLAKGFGQGIEASGGLAVRLAGGAAGVSVYVDTNKPVTKESGGKTETYSFTSTSGSPVKLVTQGGNLLLVEYTRKGEGEWFPGGLLRDEVVRQRTNPKVPKDCFSTKPAPGSTVTDERGPATHTRTSGLAL